MSLHPFIGDLSALTTDELYTKVSDVTKKLSIAFRMGSGDAVQQLQMIMADYQAEIKRRNDKMFEEMSQKSAEFKNLIDVK